MRREGAKRCENTTKPSPLPFPWLSQLRRLLGLCYWKTEERGTTGCNWGGGVPSLWGLAHPPRLLTWAGKGTKLSQPCLRFISPGKSLRCWLGWGWGGAGTQEPWNHGTTPVWWGAGEANVRGRAGSEVETGCENPPLGRFVGQLWTGSGLTLLDFGIQQYFCWALDNMGCSIQGKWEEAGSRQASVWDRSKHIRNACMGGSQSTSGLRKKKKRKKFK